MSRVWPIGDASSKVAPAAQQCLDPSLLSLSGDLHKVVQQGSSRQQLINDLLPGVEVKEQGIIIEDGSSSRSRFLQLAKMFAVVAIPVVAQGWSFRGLSSTSSRAKGQKIVALALTSKMTVALALKMLASNQFQSLPWSSSVASICHWPCTDTTQQTLPQQLSVSTSVWTNWSPGYSWSVAYRPPGSVHEALTSRRRTDSRHCGRKTMTLCSRWRDGRLATGCTLPIRHFRVPKSSVFTSTLYVPQWSATTWRSNRRSKNTQPSQAHWWAGRCQSSCCPVRRRSGLWLSPTPHCCWPLTWSVSSAPLK